MGTTPPAAGPKLYRDIGRPALAYLAAAAAAAAAIAAGIFLTWGATTIVRGATAFGDLQALPIIVSVVGAWLAAFVGISLATAGPAIIGAWIGHAAKAPRPMTEVLVATILGPVLLLVLAPVVKFPAVSLWVALAWGSLFAFAGGVGGYTYARIVGPRA